MFGKKILFGALVGALVVGALILPTSAATDPVTDFSDVHAAYKYVKAIDYLRENGVVVGYEDGTFRPDTNINRAEFLKIVMENSDLPLGGSDCYPDVHDEWFAQYVCAATDAGLVSGYPDGTFKPGQNINFAEASKIVVNTLNLELGAAGDLWFESFVHSLEAEEAIPFDVAGFDKDLTRGQMSEMIWRIVADRTYKPSKTFGQLQTGEAVGDELAFFDSCKELHDYLDDNTSEPWFDDSDYDFSGLPNNAVMVAISGAELGGGAGVAQDFSSTNLQEEGVDEADVVKNDGKYIYTLKDGGVRIVEAYPPSGMKEVGEINYGDEDFYPVDMYLDGDRLVVIGDEYASSGYYSYDSSAVDPDLFYSGGAALVFVYDVSNPALPKQIRRVAIEGDYKSSRKVGGVVYMVANQNTYARPWLGDDWKEEDLVPLYEENDRLDKLVGCDQVMYMPKVIDQADYLLVTAIPLDPSVKISEQVVVGSSREVYASPENLYVAQQKYPWFYWYEETGDEEQTFIHKFSLDGNTISYKGLGAVPGSVLNQFSMDEDNGNFRIVTTSGDVWDADNPSKNNLYVLDSDLNLIGSLQGLAKGERVYSARFVGDRAYIVTFKKVDPLFVIGIEDPSNPKVLGELKIPGFSDYLHPYDEDHLIGFGLETEEGTAEEIADRGIDFAWYQGVKLAMFDVSDVNNPVELHRVIIGDRGTTSPLNYNHKALLYSTSKGVNGGALMAFPIAVAEIPEEVKNDPNSAANTYGDIVFQGAYVYDVSVADGFKLRGTVTHYDESDFGESGYYWYGNNDIERVLYIGNYLYTVSNDMVKANDIVNLVNEISSVILPSG